MPASIVLGLASNSGVTTGVRLLSEHGRGRFEVECIWDVEIGEVVQSACTSPSACSL